MVESKNTSAVRRSSRIYHFGSCCLDTALREIRVDDAVVDVQPKVFDLLLFLIENRHRMVGKDELLSQIWPNSIVTESSLTQTMRKARAITGDDGDRQEVIRTLQKRGYRFIAPVELIKDGATGSADKIASTAPGSLLYRFSQLTFWRAITLGAAVSILGTAILIGNWPILKTDNDRISMDSERSDERSESTGPRKTYAPSNSIAVLPFVDLSEDKTNEYFADGLSEELLNVLANVPNLHVAARTSSFSFKEITADIPTIAEQLKVAHILEGSVRKADDRIRITVQLISADSGYHLWSKSFDRDFDDIFVVQQEIATAVARSLRITMLGDRMPPFAKTSSDAYTLFLQGRHFLRRSTPDSIAQSIEYLTRATVLDSGFARCWHLLGSAYIRQANFGLVPHDEGYTKGRAAVTKALEIDPELSMAHAQLGWIALYHDYDVTLARRHIERALVLQPGDYETLSYAGTVALGLGQLSEAIALRERVVAIDPLGRGGYHNLGVALYYAGQLDAAVAMYGQALSLSPDYLSGHYFLGLVLLAQGEAQAALDEFDLEIDEAWRLEGRALAFHDLGHNEESAVAMTQLEDKFADDMTYQIGEVHAYRGEIDASFAWLERAYEQRDGGLWELRSSPLLVDLHEDARWDTLIYKMGFAN